MTALDERIAREDEEDRLAAWRFYLDAIDHVSPPSDDPDWEPDGWYDDWFPYPPGKEDHANRVPV